MSSIYRKGRDGIYYYQAYVFNPKTGKINKRIFHSLGTKDKSEAIEQQVKLDKKYQKLKKNSGKYGTLKALIGKKGPYLVSIVFFIGFYILQKKSSEHIRDLNDDIAILEKNLKTNDVDKPVEKNQEADTKIETDQSIKDAKMKDKAGSAHLINDIIIPSYNIIRTEKTSGGSNMIKIYATVNGSHTEQVLISLCRNIKKIFHKILIL